MQLTRDYYKARNERRKTSSTPRRVSATPARNHLRNIMARDRSLTSADLAKQCGVSRRAIDLVLAADATRMVNVTTALAILSLPLPDRGMPTGGRNVSGVVARRMVEALLTQGWTMTDIAEHAGLSRSTLAPRNLDSCTTATVAAVTRVFNEYKYRSGSNTQTAAWARRQGCAPWSAWPDITNPAAAPDPQDMDPVWANAIRARWRNR